jgi:hypothetical protein
LNGYKVVAGCPYYSKLQQIKKFEYKESLIKLGNFLIFVLLEIKFNVRLLYGFRTYSNTMG